MFTILSLFILIRVPEAGSWGEHRAKSEAAAQEAADHPLPQSQEPGVQPQTAAAATAAGCMVAQQERTGHRRESQSSHLEENYSFLCFAINCVPIVSHTCIAFWKHLL